jgi:cytochrome c oxidase cbb3-type subunit 3
VRARHLLSAWWLGSFIAVAGACRRTPPDLREWKATDHDQADEQNPSRAAPNRAAPPPKGAPSGSANPALALVEIAWRNQCSACHGPIGRGDGPQGPMLKAPDLTAADWQSKVTDEQIRQVISNGKNRMPKFDLPDDLVTGLVARIRASKGK